LTKFVYTEFNLFYIVHNPFLVGNPLDSNIYEVKIMVKIEVAFVEFKKFFLKKKCFQIKTTSPNTKKYL
jgi:hypothetical protein